MRHLTRVPKCFSFTQSNLWQEINYFVYIWVFLRVVVGVLVWTFQFDLHFRSEIPANLTANWKTRGLSKPGNKIINHCGNWVTKWTRGQEELWGSIRPYIREMASTHYICQENKAEEDSPALKIACIYP